MENEIQWLNAKKEIKSKNCHTVRHGVKCNRCGCFQDSPSRFCKDCGGKFNGELPNKNFKERLFV